MGKARWAVDGKDDTMWDVTVPADGQPIGVGLLIDLGSPQAVGSIELQAPTNGYKIEVYAAKHKAPKSVTSDALAARPRHPSRQGEADHPAHEGEGQGPPPPAVGHDARPAR